MAKLRFDSRTKQWSSDSYVHATSDYTCSCGAHCIVTIDWPQGVIVEGAVIVSDKNCTRCGAATKFPEAHYYIEGSRLLSRPLA